MKTLDFTENEFNSDTPFSILFKLLHKNKSKFTNSDWNNISQCLEALREYSKIVPTKDQIGTSNYYDRFLKRIEKLVGVEIKQNTYEKFAYVGNQLSDFINWQYKKQDVPLKSLKDKFLDDFEYYLKTVKNQKQVTVNKTVQRFRTPIKYAIAEGIIKKDPFLLYRSSRVRKEVIFLTASELKKLELHEFTKPNLTFIKDLFIFCCYTGMPYLEMRNLKKEHLQSGFDGNTWIEISRQKTNRKLSVPLLPKPARIIEKYVSPEKETIFPAISNQRFNIYLKEIAKALKISKRITHHTARKTFASTVLLYNDISMEIVSELLGHSSILITEQSYGKIINKKVSEAMAVVRLKLGDV